MKKYILVVAGLLLIAGTASAQTSLRGLLEQISKLSLVGQVSKSSTLTPIATTVGPSEPYSQGLPPGSINQTLRHNGSSWVATGNLLNYGDRLQVEGNVDFPLVVSTQHSPVSSAFTGANTARGVGIAGSSSAPDDATSATAVGILGIAGPGAFSKAVEAWSLGTGYGFYQGEPNAKNYFAGKVGTGNAHDPQEQFDLGGGNIKMGYEYRTSNGLPTSNGTVAQCSSVDKYVLGGGCSASGNDSLNAVLVSSQPNFDGAHGWGCTYKQPANQVGPQVQYHAYAICANIR